MQIFFYNDNKAWVFVLPKSVLIRKYKSKLSNIKVCALKLRFTSDIEDTDLTEEAGAIIFGISDFNCALSDPSCNFNDDNRWETADAFFIFAM